MNKAAQALGKLARGKPKKFSPEELRKRTKRLLQWHSSKQSKHKKE
jgi:hypothetical protein